MLRAETRGRARALQLLYAWETTGRPVEALLPGLARLVGARPAVLEAAAELAAGVVRERSVVDGLIATATLHWRLGRLAVLDRNVLRIGAYELLHGAVPPRVAIDQALWLAHRFGTPESPSFVNGVLDRVARDLGRL
jgi:N utilization substance protein B